MSVDAGPVQRGVALGVRDVGVRVLGEEMLHYLEVPIGGGEEERSTASTSAASGDTPWLR